LIALQINDWNEQKKEDAFEVEILENLRADFIENQELLVKAVSNHEKVVEGLTTLVDIIGPKPKVVTNNEIDEILLSMAYLPEYKPSDGVILSVMDSDNLSLIKNAEIRQLIRSWPSRIKGYQFSALINYDYYMEHIYPFLSKYYAMKNLDISYVTKNKKDEGKSRFEVNYTDLLSNREFENHAEMRRVNARTILNSAKSLLEYQQRLLAALDEELAP